MTLAVIVAKLFSSMFYPKANMTHPNVTQKQPNTEYKYMVKIINPKKKTDFVLVTWHHVSAKFESLSELKLKLMDDFSEFVPSTPQFQVGCMEGNSKQHLIISREDLEAMYKSDLSR